MKPIVITIDGPSGTGKSSVARTVARTLGYVYLDSGALYRACALAVDKEGADIDDDRACSAIVERLDIDLNLGCVAVNGLDVTEAIRSPRISALSSRIAVHPGVRRILLGFQRQFASTVSLVAEGRDTGSVIFPGADVKIFLSATVEARARRRFDELMSKGMQVDYGQVLKDIRERDERDAARVHAPLIVPEHAVVVDTTHLKLEEVIQTVLKIIKKQLSD